MATATKSSGEQAMDLLARARISLIRGKDSPRTYFGTLSMRLIPVVDDTIDTAATDGKRLFVSPKFWNSLTDKERVGVTCHEVLHCSNKHHVRRGQRDPKLWNVACDLAINPIVISSGFTLPTGCLFPRMFNYPEFKTAEWYYGKLQSDGRMNNPNLQGSGDGDDPGQCGGVMDAGSSQSELDRSDQEWTRAAAQAAQQSKGRGNMPGCLQANIDRTLKPKVNYWDLLHQYMTRNDRSDYSWSKPNRRHLHTGRYLPALWSQKIGKIVVTVDTSGSCWERPVLDRFAAEVEGVRQVMPSQVVVIYHDTDIQGQPEVIEADEPFRLAPQGGGGTSHRKVFRLIENDHDDADVVICLTDLETEFPHQAPEIPVIWITIEDHDAPFGDVVFIDDQEAAAAF